MFSFVFVICYVFQWSERPKFLGLNKTKQKIELNPELSFYE